eukprot:977317-Pyramimonas_sp.AAC.1
MGLDTIARGRGASVHSAALPALRPMVRTAPRHDCSRNGCRAYTCIDRFVIPHQHGTHKMRDAHQLIMANYHT